MSERRLPIACRGEPGCYLFHRPATTTHSDERPAVLVCPGFIQNRKAFEVPGRSFLEHLRESGFDVYALELAKHVRHEGEGLAYYTDRAATEAVRYVKERHPTVAWLGHSMGGLIGVGLPPHVTASLDAMVVIGAPLKPGLGVALARGVEGLAARIGGALSARGLPFRGTHIAAGFHIGKVVLDHPFARFPLQIWAPGHLTRDELDWCLSNAFVEDSWTAFSDMLELAVTDGERAGWVRIGERLRALELPLLVLSGDRDGLAPRRSTRPLFERAGSRDKRFLEVGIDTVGVPFGHIDLLVGRHAPAHVWAPVTDFLVEKLMGQRPHDRPRATPPMSATPRAAPSAEAPSPRAAGQRATR